MVIGWSAGRKSGMPKNVQSNQKQPRFRPTFIAKWREFRGLTQEQLAARLDMTQSHLSMLENRKRGYTQETLEAIAEALQTDAASLLMRNPLSDEAIWSIWEQAKPGERQMIVNIAKTVLKTGT
jgi:transcriptional regulator with XRE-family HTH domain